jgi:phospholipid/cholesterol/gamma-HCH transport system substrate-binding protein
MTRKQPSAFANPVLIGAVTVLVLLVAVFLAYNANEGLPFVPTRQLKVDIANGSELVAGNDVREGGYLIGLVSSLKPVTMENGQVGAQLTLKLNKAYGEVPIDSTVSIQPRSVLGLKYLDLHKGTSSHMFADGATLPESQTNVPVQFDDVFKMFDPKTRGAVQEDLDGFGDTLASRGSALNDTIASLPALFGKMATTFGAIDRNPPDLKATIAESPSTLQVSTQSLAAQQPLLTDLTTFGQYMTPATKSLEVALPVLNPALEQGTQVLGRTPALNARLQDTMQALQTLSAAPGTNVALNALVDTVQTLNPMVRYLGPFQTVCDDWNYWWTYLSEHLSEATAFGFAQRAMLMTTNTTQSNNVGSQGATAPADGGSFDSPQGGNEYLHGEVYGAAIDNQGNADCETGQRGYPLKLNYYDPQGRNLDSDAHTPGDQGPTFAGRAHVPAGETFTRTPQTGVVTPPVPGNN